MTPEKSYERLLCSYAKRAGALCIKQTGEYNKGIPDRLIIRADGTPLWVELKSPGNKPTKIQLKYHDMLRQRGQKVYVIDSSISLEAFRINELNEE